MAAKQIILVIDVDLEVGELVCAAADDGIPMHRDGRFDDLSGKARGRYDSYPAESYDPEVGWY
jgi:hypothetical protein